MALEPESVLNSQPDKEAEELQEELQEKLAVEKLAVEELQIDDDYENEKSAQGHSLSQLERTIKCTLLASACFAAIYAGIIWYDKHEQLARELEIVPPPPTAVTGFEIFDIDKAPNSNTNLGKKSQQVSLQSIN